MSGLMIGWIKEWMNSRLSYFKNENELHFWVRIDILVCIFLFDVWKERKEKNCLIMDDSGEVEKWL